MIISRARLASLIASTSGVGLLAILPMGMSNIAKAMLPAGTKLVDLAGAVEIPEARLFDGADECEGIPTDPPRLAFFSVTPVPGSPRPRLETSGSTLRRARPSTAYMANWIRGVSAIALSSAASFSVAAGVTNLSLLGGSNPVGDVRAAHWITTTVCIPSLNNDTGLVTVSYSVAGNIQTVNGNAIGALTFGPLPVSLRKGLEYKFVFIPIIEGDDGEKVPPVLVGDSVTPVSVTFVNPVGSNTATVRHTTSATSDDLYKMLVKVILPNSAE